MKEEVLPTLELSYSLLDFLKVAYPSSLFSRFGMENIASMDNDSILVRIAQRRLLLDGSRPSIDKAAYLLVKEFKDGVLGRLSLECPCA